MNLLFHLIIIALTLSLTLSCAHNQSSVSQSSELNRQVVCLSLFYDCVRTSGAHDWPNLVRTSQRYIESCRDIHSAEDISSAYADIAMALLKMNRPNDALDAANSCSSSYYPNPDCHLRKTEALVRLNRFEEAKNSLNNAEITTKHALSTIDSYIIASPNPKEKELYLLKKSNYMKTLESIELFKKNLFP